MLPIHVCTGQSLSSMLKVTRSLLGKELFKKVKVREEEGTKPRKRKRGGGGGNLN